MLNLSVQFRETAVHVLQLAMVQSSGSHVVREVLICVRERQVACVHTQEGQGKEGSSWEMCTCKCKFGIGVSVRST